MGTKPFKEYMPNERKLIKYLKKINYSKYIKYDMHFTQHIYRTLLNAYHDYNGIPRVSDYLSALDLLIGAVRKKGSALSEDPFGKETPWHRCIGGGGGNASTGFPSPFGPSEAKPSDSPIECGDVDEQNLMSKLLLKYFAYKIMKNVYCINRLIFVDDNIYHLNEDKLWRLDSFPRSIKLYSLCNEYIISNYLSIKDYENIYQEIVHYF